MRNLKKLLAVILTVAMIASLMVPALASFTYSDEARKLQAIEVMAGGEDDLKLDENVTRIQGLAFAIRAAGKDADALAMAEEDIDAILADWVDADEIPAWGRAYAAYAIDNGYLAGTSATEKRVDALKLIDGPSLLVFVMKSGMNYTDVTTANALVKAQEAEIITEAQAAALLNGVDIIRDSAAGILYGAFKTGKNADGTLLIDAYIASGATTKEAAAAAGFVAPAPADLVALDAKGVSRREIVVNFNTELGDGATNKDNYSVSVGEIESVKLNAGNKSVTILLKTAVDNQKAFDVTVKTGVKGATGGLLAAETKLSGNIFDTTIPAAVSAEHTGIYSFKVNFSEPVTATAGNFKVDGGTYFIEKVESKDNGYAVEVTLYAKIPNGEHKVEVSGYQDLVPYTGVATTLTFVATQDETAPSVAKVISASPSKVELEMTENVFFAADEAKAKENIFHTNSANKPDSVSIDGNKVTLVFTSKTLPKGTVYLTIGEKLFKDAWNNENAKADATLNVVVDEIKPTVKDAKAINDKTIEIEFSEDIVSGKGKFTVKDSAGADVKVDSTTYTATKVTLSFNKSLPGSTYKVVIEDVEDIAGNKIEKVEPAVAVTDTTAPELTGADYYQNKQMVIVKFNEVMNASDITNKANFAINGAALNEKVTLTVSDNGKAVTINFKDVADADKAAYNTYAGISTITVGKVRDISGNATPGFSNDILKASIANIDATGVEVDSLEATDKKTIVLKFKSELANYASTDFAVYVDGAKAVLDRASFANVDGKGVVTFSLKNELPTGWTAADYAKVEIVASPSSKNALDVPVKDGTYNVADKIAAGIKEVLFTTPSSITIVFTEDVALDTIARGSFTVADNTVKAIEKPAADRVVLVLDKVVAAGTEITITQVNSFEDAKGNVSKEITFKEKVK